LLAGLNHGDRFGIGPGVPTDIVPDFGDTLLLFALSLMALIVTRMIQMQFHEPRGLQRSSVRFTLKALTFDAVGRRARNSTLKLSHRLPKNPVSGVPKGNDVIIAVAAN
jgi:hypothetical protein